MTATTPPAQAPAPKSTQRSIPVNRIDRDPDQPRKFFDAAALEQLATSMKTTGQLQPIRVKYRKTDRRYTLIAGERRWRAACDGGIAELDAVVVHDAGDSFLASVVENTARADMTPMEEARAFYRLADEYGMTVEEIEAACGKTAAYVQWRLDLLDLTAPAQQALEEGHLPVGLAWYLSKVSLGSQQQAFKKWVRGEFKTPRDAEAWVKARRHAEAAQPDVGMFEVAEPTEEEKAKLRQDRQRLANRFDRLAPAGEILQEFADTDPAELARILTGVGGGAAAYQQQLEALAKVASRAISQLRKAAAISSAGLPAQPRQQEMAS